MSLAAVAVRLLLQQSSVDMLHISSAEMKWVICAAELSCADWNLTSAPQYFASVISSLLVVAWIGQQVHNLFLTYLIGEYVTTHTDVASELPPTNGFVCFNQLCSPL